MEIKKSPKADLEHSRGWRLLLGGALAVGLLLAALNLPFREKSIAPDVAADDFFVEELPELPVPEPQDMISSAVVEPEVKTVVVAVDDPVAEVVNNVEASVETAHVEAEVSATDSTKADDTNTVPLVPDDDPIHFKIVQQVPEFPGGMSGFTRWLTANLQYPELLSKYHIQGQVIVSFVINKDGTTSDFKIEKSDEPRMDQEVMRVLKLMPRWKPGYQDDQPCRTLFVVPVSFKM